MGTFWTEKETENWLESETRMLPLPDGTILPHTDFRLTWSLYDDVLGAGYTPEQIIRWTVQETELGKMDFHKAFTAIVAYVDKQVRKRDQN